MNRIDWYPLGFGMLAVLGAASAFDPAFVGARWVIAVLVAVVVSSAIMAWSTATRTGAGQTTFLSAGAAVVTTVATILYRTLGSSITTTLGDFLDGLTSGWNHALQEDLPLVQPTLPLVWVTIMVWVTAAIVARATSAGRTSLVVFLAPCILLAMATSVTLPDGPPSILPALIVAVGLLGVLATTTAREIDWSWGQVRAIALVIAAAIAFGAVAMTASPDNTEGSFDPRSLRNDNPSNEQVPDLFGQLSEITSAQASPAVNLQVIDGARPTRLRLAVYDTYDGERWQTTTTFREILQFIPPVIAPPGESSAVQVQLLASPGPWLPLLDRVVGIRPSVRGWDPVSGTALADGQTATVRGTVVTQADMSGSTAASTEVDARYTALPSATPAAILDMAAETTAGLPDARSAVIALRDAVIALGRDDSVPSGHSLGRLAADVEAAAPMAAEQLVALHATLVRAVGIPSRIVVGYAVGENDEIETTDLIAWTEAAFAGVGWVPFNPVPVDQVTGQGSGGETTATTTTLPGQAVTEAQVVPRELDPGERNTDDLTHTPGAGLGWLEAAILATGLVVLVIACIVIARGVRRRSRRRATSAPWSVAGAWGELLDRLRENSAPAPPNRTVEEAIDQVEDMAPDASGSLREFTKLVNVTLYSDNPPTWDDAEDAWQLLRDIEVRLRQSQGRTVSVRARLDPRSLRYPTPRPAPNRSRRPHVARPVRTDHPRVQR